MVPLPPLRRGGTGPAAGRSDCSLHLLAEPELSERLRFQKTKSPYLRSQGLARTQPEGDLKKVSGRSFKTTRAQGNGECRKRANTEFGARKGTNEIDGGRSPCARAEREIAQAPAKIKKNKGL